MRCIAIDGARFSYDQLKIPLHSLNLSEWLSRQTHYPKVYWNDGNIEYAALGNILCFEKAPRFEEGSFEDIRFYGGMHFPSKKKDPIWASFPQCAFWLPSFEIVQTKTSTELIIHSIDTHASELALQNLLFEKPSLAPMPFPDLLHRRDSFSFDEWKDHIAHLHNAMKREQVQKVVLARSSKIDFSFPPSVWQILDNLKGKADRSTLFAFELAPNIAFFGASPEKLFSRYGKNLKIDAVAGTRKRGACRQEDLLLEEDLIHHSKDALEFRMVKDFICEAAHHFAEGPCHWLKQDQILKTPCVQHIYNQANILLKNGISDRELIECLHPTPAVGGFPRDQALQQIFERESFQRGWYAAPIGWISPAMSDLTVAIRSGLLQGPALHLFAGAGIVAQSCAENEWNEIDHKMRLLMDLFRN